MDADTSLESPSAFYNSTTNPFVNTENLIKQFVGPIVKILCKFEDEKQKLNEERKDQKFLDLKAELENKASLTTVKSILIPRSRFNLVCKKCSEYDNYPNSASLCEIICKNDCKQSNKKKNEKLCRVIDQSTKLCKNCGCNWKKHLHTEYTYSKENFKTEIENILKHKKSVVLLKKSIQDYENEQKTIFDISANFGHLLILLKSNLSFDTLVQQEFNAIDQNYLVFNGFKEEYSKSLSKLIEKNVKANLLDIETNFNVLYKLAKSGEHFKELAKNFNDDFLQVKKEENEFVGEESNSSSSPIYSQNGLNFSVHSRSNNLRNVIDTTIKKQKTHPSKFFNSITVDEIKKSSNKSKISEMTAQICDISEIITSKNGKSKYRDINIEDRTHKQIILRLFCGKPNKFAENFGKKFNGEIKEKRGDYICLKNVTVNVYDNPNNGIRSYSLNEDWTFSYSILLN